MRTRLQKVSIVAFIIGVLAATPVPAFARTAVATPTVTTPVTTAPLPYFCVEQSFPLEVDVSFSFDAPPQTTAGATLSLSNVVATVVIPPSTWDELATAGVVFFNGTVSSMAFPATGATPASIDPIAGSPIAFSASRANPTFSVPATGSWTLGPYTVGAGPSVSFSAPTVGVTAGDAVPCLVPSALLDTIPVVAPGAPVAIAAVSGSGQGATRKQPFASPLTARVTDADSLAVAGVKVTFAAPTRGPSGTFPGPNRRVQVLTDANGVATAPAFYANTKPGSYAVTATVRGVTPSAAFTLTNEESADVSLRQALRPASDPSRVVATFTVKNRGPNAATGLTIHDYVDTLPYTVGFTSNDPAATCQAAPTGPQHSGLELCKLPMLAKGATWTTKVTFTASFGSGPFDAFANVDTTSVDPNPANNVDNESTRYP